jgi:hypothetical protein
MKRLPQILFDWTDKFRDGWDYHKNCEIWKPGLLGRFAGWLNRWLLNHFYEDIIPF